ncbi:MAG: phosphate starvation-inducible protein PhoH [Acidobacteria bacterium]|nr:phosphate starvation-inducible protein PhoH [Acidobacteriota bacterium]|tara:strand:- start:9081 stop:10439 length:1359 start_codon:yes stop_codon:yes gene_type:complete
MTKNFVIDTNVLLYDPRAIFAFEDNNIFIPLPVIEEVDSKKKADGDLGYAAREINRILDNLREKAFNEETSLHEGVELDSGGLLRILVDAPSDEYLPKILESEKVDNMILSMAKALQDQLGESITVISKDSNMRIKADVLGLEAMDYENSKVNTDFLTLKVPTRVVTSDYLSLLNTEVEDDYGNSIPVKPDDIDSYHFNEHINLVPEGFGDDCKPTFVRKDSKGNIKIVHKYANSDIFGISPKNEEQMLAMDLLLDPELKFVSLLGPAGTGKSLLGLAAGLHLVNQGVYDKVVIFRPAVSVGEDIGFLPGSLREKLGPWVRSIADNLDVIMPNADSKMKNVNGLEELEHLGMIEIDSLSHVRGRSMQRAFIIGEEFQNTTPRVAKTLITRLGEGSKLVFMGDPHQIDLAYVDSRSNGLSYATDRMKFNRIVGFVNLHKTERSEIAELGAKLL